MPTDLWSFALNYYSRPGVEQLCLRLQDDGVDVCLLLCTLWLERRQIAYSAARLEQLRIAANVWQRQVVQPLRKLRRDWKTDSHTDSALAGLREQIKALELEAERELLGRLERIAQPWQTTNTAEAWLEQLVDEPAVREELRRA